MRTGYAQALATAIAAAVAGGLIATAVAKALKGIPDRKIPWKERPAHWPEKLKGRDAFDALGKAIQQEAGYKELENDIDRTRYVFDRFRKAADVYDFKAATQGLDQGKVSKDRPDNWMPPAGAVLGGAVFVGGSLLLGGLPAVAIGVKTLIGLGVSVGGGYLGGKALGDWIDDPELAGSLKKGPGSIGNCGEISYAFQATLGGAGVNSSVVFADNDSTSGRYSGQHNIIPGQGYVLTDTAVMVTRTEPGARQPVPRIFDPYRQLLHNPGTDAATQPSDWADLPPTKAEVTTGKGPQTSWLDDKLRNNSNRNYPKNYIKDQNLNLIFKDPSVAGSR